MVRGDLDQLLATADFANPATTTECLADNQVQTALIGLETPDLGEAVWYLVRPQNGGSYDSGGPSQLAPRDASISGSGNDCP